MKKLRSMAVLFVLCLVIAVFCGQAESAKLRPGHVIPVDKGVSRAQMERLHERGEPAVYSGDDLFTIGMPVGGIAAGQLYVRGDGTLAVWQIFNKHVFTGYGADCYRTYRPESPVDSGFALYFRDGGHAEGRPVNAGYSVRPLNKDFGRVEFEGEYPVAVVRYSNEHVPVQVEMKAFSPFIPLNARDSALPATVFHITLKNTSSDVLDTGLVGWLENAVCMHSAPSILAQRRSRIVNEKGRAMVVHTVEEAPPDQRAVRPRETVVLADFEGGDYGDWKTEGEAFGKGPARGTLQGQQNVSGFVGKGLVNTFIDGDPPQGTLTSAEFEVSRKFINFLIGGGNYAGRTCINLLIDGVPVRTAVGRNNEKLDWHFWNVEQFEGATAQIQIVDRASGGWGHVNVDQIELADKPRNAFSGPIEELPDYGSMVLAFEGSRASSSELPRELSSKPNAWNAVLSFDSASALPVARSKTTGLCAKPIILKPGASRTFKFVLSWFFPNHQHGREYDNRFDSASEVAHYVLDNHERLAGDTMTWHRTFYEDSTLPRWLLFRLHSTVSNLATGTCQWWQSGRFWAWEGVGCCPGTCTHVWNYAHAPARLFPRLERSAREFQDFGEGFHPDSGLVGFRSNHAYAADGQCGTILKAYREHQMSRDANFLRRIWPRVKKALEFCIAQDGNADGLIENSQHNTFDINFEGPNTFVGSLYLAALRAGEEMAREMDDPEFAEQCHDIFESGSRLTVERLWDGEYFIEDVDLEKHPRHQYGKGCLSDQLFGQGWAHRLGLGYIYPRKYVKQALESVWTYNWTPDVGPYNETHKPERWFARAGEPGLFTCTWPKTPYIAEGVRYKNEVWTGIEYQVAGHMVAEGLVDEALAICHGIQQRYHPSKHNPFNEVECGDHYARAFASWGVYNALLGYEYHGPKGRLGFGPVINPNDFRAAFTTADGWGTFEQTRNAGRQYNMIDLRWGRLRLKSLAFELQGGAKAGKVTVRAAGKVVGSEHSVKDGRLELDLKEELKLSTGESLEVVIELKS